MIFSLIIGLPDEKMKRVKQAKERERNQKSLAQKRSELLQEQPIVPDLTNVESKLKTMMITRDRNESHIRSEILRKRNAKPPGKVIFLNMPFFNGTLYLDIKKEVKSFSHKYFRYYTNCNSFSGTT